MTPSGTCTSQEMRRTSAEIRHYPAWPCLRDGSGLVWRPVDTPYRPLTVLAASGTDPDFVLWANAMATSGQVELMQSRNGEHQSAGHPRALQLRLPEHRRRSHMDPHQQWDHLPRTRLRPLREWNHRLLRRHRWPDLLRRRNLLERPPGIVKADSGGCVCL